MFEGRGGGRGGMWGNRTRVWVLDENKKLKPVPVRLGLNDGTNSEVVNSPLKEGDEVIVGVVSSDQPRAPQTNPFSPQQPGGGRRF